MPRTPVTTPSTSRSIPSTTWNESTRVSSTPTTSRTIPTTDVSEVDRVSSTPTSYDRYGAYIQNNTGTIMENNEGDFMGGDGLFKVNVIQTNWN